MKKNPEEFYNTKAEFKTLYDKLTRNEVYKRPEDNQIIKTYIDAKIKGNYKQIIYDVSKPHITCKENIRKLKYLNNFFNKPFKDLTQEDIDKLQEAINNDTLYLTPNEKLRIKEKTPITRSYKQDLIKHIKQFWKFYRLYSKEELRKELPEITEFLRLRRERNKADFEYLTLKEIMNLVKHTKNQQQKTLLLFAFETGGRTIEVLNVQRKHFSFNEENKSWSVILPELKGNSHDKIRIDLDLSSQELDKYLSQNEFKPEDYIFQYTQPYFRKLLSQLGKNALKKKITPKIFRKSCAIYLINQNVNSEYIKAHIGWSPDTSVLKHYIKQTSLKKPSHLKRNIKAEAYEDYETKQAVMKSELEQMKNLIQDLINFKEETKKELLTKKETDIRNDQTIQILKQFHKITRTSKKR